jgi:hypothetical protein
VNDLFHAPLDVASPEHLRLRRENVSQSRLRLSEGPADGHRRRLRAASAGGTDVLS